MKIIAGYLKGKNILITKENSYRPTTGKTKEAIFSILSSGQFINQDTNESVLKGAITLDLFGGTGALTFEAISRGASKGIIIENNSHNIKTLETNIKRFNIQHKINLLKINAIDLPMASLQIANKISIAFIDAPFNKNLIEKSISQLISKNWLSNSALLIIEHHEKENYQLDSEYTLITSRKYGKVILSIYTSSR